MVYLPRVFRRTTQSITWNECLAGQHWASLGSWRGKKVNNRFGAHTVFQRRGNGPVRPSGESGVACRSIGYGPSGRLKRPPGGLRRVI